MKKTLGLFLSLGLVAFTVAVAWGGLNPASPVPQVDITKNPFNGAAIAAGDNNFYVAPSGVTLVDGKRGSVICVACHTRNPGTMIPDARRTAAKGNNTGLANGYFYGSHFVTLNFNDTSEGGGYSDGTAPKDSATRKTVPAYMASTKGTFEAIPQYAVKDLAAANTNAPAPAEAQMICGSCHSLTTNIGTYKLLADGRAAGGSATDVLCVGCHGDMDGVISAEWQYFQSANWGGTQHHRNSASTEAAGGYMGTPAITQFTAGTTFSGADHNMGYVGQGAYNQVGADGKVYQMWAVSYGNAPATARGITCDNSASTGNPRMRAGLATGLIGSAYITCGTPACASPRRRWRPGAAAGGRSRARSCT